MEKVINLTPDYHEAIDAVDRAIINQRISGGPKKTRITMTDHDTGEVLGIYENKIVITGSVLAATTLFDIDSPVILPSYNSELGLENSSEPGTKPENRPYICLFCIGDSGCGTTEKDVLVSKYIDRIAPENDIMPFRYVNKDQDLNEDLRKYYFGRKIMGDKIGYYFKSFDTVPQLHLRYTDGTEINNNMYNIETTQSAECYVETRLRINRNDFRDYMEQVIGWDKARISTLSLCSAWYTEEEGIKWYQDIMPYSKLNFPFERLVDLTKAIDFNYQVFY